MQVAAAVTMVRDDLFFLKKWLDHYGGQFGRENLYVVNHGRGEAVAELAEGANVIGLPGEPSPTFEQQRWRLLGNLVQGLRQYYKHVVVGDVDELVVLDPASGRTLFEFLSNRPRGRVFTPLGLEVLHLPSLEPEPLDAARPLLSQRRHVRVAMPYSKPCVVSKTVRLSRGGHFSDEAELNTPQHLYLFHLKYVDLDLYSGVLDSRNAMTAATGVGVKETTIGGHWFAQKRGEDRAVFEGFEALRPVEGFDLAPHRAFMQRTWEQRGEGPFWNFKHRDFGTRYALPERFSEVF